MNPSQKAASALSAALEIFYGVDRELAESQRRVATLEGQLEDAIDEVHRLRDQVRQLQETALTR